MIQRAILIPAFVVSVITLAHAETPEERQACTDDAFRVCQDAIPDKDRVFRCLVQNSSVISPLCRTALTPYLSAERPTTQVTAKRTGKIKTKSRARNTTRRGKGPLNLDPNAH